MLSVWDGTAVRDVLCYSCTMFVTIDMLSEYMCYHLYAVVGEHGNWILDDDDDDDDIAVWIPVVICTIYDTSNALFHDDCRC
jgi:hypothetical protein